MKHDGLNVDEPERPLKPALLKGLRLRCPRCGRGALLHSYLKVHEECAECGLDFTPQRADDGPAYLTILLVSHVAGFGLHLGYGTFELDPLTLAVGLSLILVVLSLAMLPRIKGMLIAFQWAKRMHGF